MPNGVFLVRFKTMEMKEQVLKSRHYLFDNKPLIYRPWTKELELKKTKIEVAPVWVQLHNLPLKFWGKSLPKIIGLIGTYIKSDSATEEKSKIGFARVMVELRIDQKLPDTVSFKDEQGLMVTVEVEYEWKPVTCANFQGMGHLKEECRRLVPKKSQKPAVKQDWRPVAKGNEGSMKQRETRDNTATILVRKEPVIQTGYGEGGYSPRKFGSVSYRDALSPTQQMRHTTGNDLYNTQSYG
ncbi:hypothetical protein vseg_003447 [Gypsophila vaccaria]